MTLKEDAINLHRLLRGKIEISSRISSDNIFENSEEGRGTLSSIYTPGVAYVSKEIQKNKELAYDYTSKWNNIANNMRWNKSPRTRRYWSRRSITRNGRKSSFV